MQPSVGAQACPQAPQWVGSPVRSTHAPSHALSPPGQLAPAPLIPPARAAPAPPLPPAPLFMPAPLPPAASPPAALPPAPPPPGLGITGIGLAHPRSAA